MKFKTYDILSSLIPGFLVLFVLLQVLKYEFDKDLILIYTAVAFLLGYIVNALSSWMEDIYFFTWGGKPSNNLLEGSDIWKVRFYHSAKAKNLLASETTNTTPKKDELFSIAMRHGNGISTRVDDFNAMYAFSRALLTTTLIGSVLLLIQHCKEWQYWVVLIPSLIIVWLRCKQRAYYYAREVLNAYLKAKDTN